ncbi:MAG TPA: DUF4331 domain-containing protein [Planctomycetota bacterium]|nr:DUF4331 domain-containing protein [Planctomycetota bacterium]
MKSPLRFVRPSHAALAATATVCAALLALARPSSHREAPFISGMPQVDGTDFYMFNSYEPGKQDFVTFVADYLPLQDPYGGPNYFKMDTDARYEIKIDNDGDAIEDLTFRFQFQPNLKDIALQVGTSGNIKTVSVPLRNVGPIAGLNPPTLNDSETYTLDLVVETPTGPQVLPIAHAASGSTTFFKPVDNIGQKSIPDYAGYARGFMYRIVLPGGHFGRMFVGQRKDPFVVNLGEVFDLVNTNPLGPENGEKDDLADKNVTAFALELPKAFLTTPGQPVIGAWTSASLPRSRLLSEFPTFQQPASSSGDYVQVSRLGSPLVNEVVIGLKDKNRFNASQPKDDGQFADYVTHPTLPELLEALFGVTAPNLFPRADLVQAFATGVPGLNENGSFGEMLRLNTSIPAVPPSQQHRLGVIGGDLAGFPNGRRPGDDVVDVALRVVMGVLLPPSVAPDGQKPFTDGAFLDASFFDSAFPYLKTPIAGSPN